MTSASLHLTLEWSGRTGDRPPRAFHRGRSGSEAVKETRGAALRARRRQIGAADDEAMWFIVEEEAAPRWRCPARNPKGWWRLRADLRVARRQRCHRIASSSLLDLDPQAPPARPLWFLSQPLRVRVRTRPLSMRLEPPFGDGVGPARLFPVGFEDRRDPSHRVASSFSGREKDRFSPPSAVTLAHAGSCYLKLSIGRLPGVSTAASGGTDAIIRRSGTSLAQVRRSGRQRRESR